MEPLIKGVVNKGRGRAAQIAGGLATPGETPNEDVQADLRAALTLFIDGPIGKMISIVPLIRQAMPGLEPPTTL